LRIQNKYVSLHHNNKQIEIMRNLFESGKITEVILYSENKSDVRITMQKNKCFEIRQLNPSFNYWELCYETPSTCEWEKTLNLAKSLIK
jgi:hypothetical protein